MPKSLGQIHTVNQDYVFNVAAGADTKYLLDLPGLLSGQLQTMVRQGQYFKVVGVDMAVTEFGGSGGGGQISGELRYYAPTRGRCQAYKNAYHAVRKGMELQGVNIRGNRNYDFRVPIDKIGDYLNGSSFFNQATIDGTNGLSLTGAASGDDDIFDVYNDNIQPRQTTSVTFDGGFGLPGAPGAATDFVLNEGSTFDPSLQHVAATELESIPFQLTFTPGSDSTVWMMEWRPDPALYLAVMCGMFEVYVDEIDGDGGATDLQVSIAVHVAGWKSIMGNPDRKRRSSKKKSTSKKKGAKK
jgi:hypothetical protein